MDVIENHGTPRERKGTEHGGWATYQCTAKTHDMIEGVIDFLLLVFVTVSCFSIFVFWKEIKDKYERDEWGKVGHRGSLLFSSLSGLLKNSACAALGLCTHAPPSASPTPPTGDPSLC